MGYWKKHPRKDLEEVLEVYDQHGWRVEDPPKYYRVKCPCGDHQRSIHLTPSNPNYGKQALQWLYRQPCTETEGGAGCR
ncbi:hypothetical protein DFQ14_1074 [Halopolyspora algeriensis]|uniref:HicA-like toxin of HicAB toxin-antitoxin system n=1 Tax=Halopolyspora algeriensis TaxID=1500506 RepID=A0A368VRM4_9ACTN|nr:hypothetical protein DFQ14_1074 [Halopolyspora algeriensis]TQM56175.1 hypothetical protein FHU43_0967 [Halopolyspora algeriensis]